jgi:PAS domain S-box-containing protein
MKNKLPQLLRDIDAAEAKLVDLKKRAHAYDSPELEKDLVSLKRVQPKSANEYRLRLAEKEKLIQKTEEFSKVGRWSYVFENEIMKWSDETYKFFDYPEDYGGTLNEFYRSCIDDKATSRLPEQHEKIRNTKESVVMNQIIHTPKGIKKFISFSYFPIVDDSGVVIGFEGLVKDLTDQITVSNSLDNFFNLSNDLHCIVHMDRYFVKISPSWSKLLGYTEKELLSRSFLEFVHPDDLEKTNRKTDDLAIQKSVFFFENRYLTKSGDVVYLSWTSRLDEETQMAYCTARDITKSKLEQDELLSDLSEKELLLKEIHHRVKNNLQIISSLLSLQAGANSKHKELVKLYEDSQNRIKSMAAIHEMFYQSPQLDKIEFGEYLDKLIGDLSKSITSNEKIIELVLNVDTVYVSLDTAIPLGLLINEIVTNSIKHGADKFGDIKIFVEMKVLEKNKFQLIIGDHGACAPNDILKQSEEGLGLILINSLVEQINGEVIQLNNYTGTVYQLTFCPGI